MEVFDWIRLILGCSFMICGLVIFFTEIFGIFHFNYILNRMHAAAMGDTLGIASCMLGLIIFSGFNMTSLKLLLIVVFLWFASPVSSHVLARLEVATNENLEAHCTVYTDLEALEAELSLQAAASEPGHPETAAHVAAAAENTGTSAGEEENQNGGETS